MSNTVSDYWLLDEIFGRNTFLQRHDFRLNKRAFVESLISSGVFEEILQEELEDNIFPNLITLSSVASSFEKSYKWDCSLNLLDSMFSNHSGAGALQH